MRRLRYVVAATAASLLTALAMAPAYAAGAVLTVASVGGPPVAVGDTLAACGPETACSTSSSTCFKCTLNVSATVGSNPPAPGTATARIDSETFSSAACTISPPIVNCSLMSMPIGPLPLGVSFMSPNGVTVASPQLTLQMVCLGSTVRCVYHPHDPSGNLVGTFVNSDNTIRFMNVLFDKVSGPNICVAAVRYSATLRVTDQTQGGQPVFMN